MASEATKVDDGGPAFPVPSYVNASGETHDSAVVGMTLRDYFAATVNIDPYDKDFAEALAGPMPTISDRVGVMEWSAKANAKIRYMLADAMLAARKAGAQ